MTNLQRIGNLVFSLFMIACAAVMLLNPQGGLIVVAYVLAIGLMLYGLRKLVYYIRMARHTVGGLTVLFTAVIALDVGLFAITVIDSPELAIALYLIAYNAVSGLLTIARGIQSKMLKAPWVADVVQGLVCLLLAGCCIAFIKSGDVLLWVFCLGMLYNAGVRLVSVFKPTEIIFIQ